MFTGIVEETGLIEEIDLTEHRARIRVRAPRVTDGTRVGDSIAVSGVCLTATDVGEGYVWADLMHVTLATTTAHAWRRGTRVNLERALPAGGRMGGHIVQGHVDATATVESHDAAPEWDDVTLRVPAHLSRYVAPKGSIALDGISLTLASVQDEPGTGSALVTVSLIPETLRATTAGTWQVGDEVNVEVDVIAKYVERLLGGRA